MPAVPRPWRVVIVDDEPPARYTLSLLLSHAPGFALVAACSHGDEAVAAIERHKPDVLLLDVQMPGLDGFEVLRRIGPAAVPAVVFVTAFDRYALKAFETHALDYLLKPYSDERFAAVMARIGNRLHERSQAAAGRRLTALLASKRPETGPQQLIVRDSGKTLIIPYDDIVWIEAEDYYVRVHSVGRHPLVRLALKTLVERLDPDRFVRVHRRAIVNLSRVRAMAPLASGDQRLILSDGTELRVSRTFRAALEERLGRR